MSNPKFTPGPWRIVQREEQNFVSKPKNVRVGPAICGVEKSTTTISIYANPGAWQPCPDVKELDAIGHANADLIAAAPDLYEAAEMCSRLIEEPEITLIDIIKKCKAALAKARGENLPTP